jgi:hypothetical protein
VEYIEAFEAFVAAVNIGGDVAEGMAYVEAGAAGVGKHIKHVALGFAEIVVHGVGAGLLPVLLPFFFYFPEMVDHNPLWLVLRLAVVVADVCTAVQVSDTTMMSRITAAGIKKICCGPQGVIIF